MMCKQNDLMANTRIRFLIIFCVIFFVSCTPSIQEEVWLSESISLISSEQVISQNEYVGTVSIIITGEGWLKSSERHDAFYSYPLDESDISPYDGLRIDQRGIIFRILSGIRPNFSPEHDYAFRYYVGEEARPITFSMQGTASNSEFTIMITKESLYRGR